MIRYMADWTCINRLPIAEQSIQAMDAGVITALEAHYQAWLVARILEIFPERQKLR